MDHTYCKHPPIITIIRRQYTNKDEETLSISEPSVSHNTITSTDEEDDYGGVQIECSHQHPLEELFSHCPLCFKMTNVFGFVAIEYFYYLAVEYAGRDEPGVNDYEACFTKWYMNVNADKWWLCSKAEALEICLDHFGRSSHCTYNRQRAYALMFDDNIIRYCCKWLNIQSPTLDENAPDMLCEMECIIEEVTKSDKQRSRSSFCVNALYAMLIAEVLNKKGLTIRNSAYNIVKSTLDKHFPTCFEL